MGLKFLQDIVNLDNIQFVNGSGTNAGLINMDGDDLVLSNPLGDILLGDGSADVFIGDGVNNVDIRFEQSGSITADNASATLTIGGTGNLVVEEPTINNPTFSGSFNLGSKLTLSTSNGYILFDYEPAGDTAEYTTEVPLLKVDHNGTEKTILSRISENGGIQLGHDDSVLITAGDVGDEIKANWGATNENVVLASEAGFYALAFPNNSTTWSNRNIFRFYGGSATASENGLYIGDGSSTQFIDLDRNLKNIGTIDSGAVTVTAEGTATLTLRGDSNNSQDTGQLDSTIKMLHDDGTHGILMETKNYAGKQSFEIKSLASGTESSRFLIHEDNYITTSGNINGRDIATDGTKLDTIATNADVTPSWVPSSDPSYLTAHPNISAASSVNNSGLTHIQDITVDSNGHVTGIVSHTLNGSDFVIPGSTAALNEVQCGTYTHTTDIAFVLDTDNNETASFFIKDGAGNSPFILTEAGDLTITGKFVSTYAAKGSSGDILVEDSGEIKKRTPAELKTDLSLNNVPNTDATNATNLASGTVPAARLATTTIAKGGTGSTTASGARTALGLGSAATSSTGDFAAANHNHDSDYAALSHNHAASSIVTGTLDDGRISESSVTQHEAALSITEGQLPDDMPSDKVKQICTSHHNFFMNSSSTSADFFVPFNNLNESSNPTNAQYYNRMVAPYNGRIVKVVLHTTAAIGTACQVLFWVATSAGVFAPSAAETVTGVNLNTANSSATATFSTNSTAQFSAEDVLGVSIIKSSSATANMQVTVVWEYTL